MKKCFFLLCAILSSLVTLSEELVCGEVDCPPEAATCSLKYIYATKPRRKITTVNCYNPYQKNIFTKTYDSPSDAPVIPIPLVECGGYQCKPGAYNCTTITTPSVNVKPPTQTTHLICRDDEGEIIEERDFVRNLSEPEASGLTPPTCEGHTCPKGSRSCTYDTVIHLEPYNKTTHVKCYDIKKRKTEDIVLVL